MVRRRHMVRSYRADPVDPAAVKRITDAFRSGPTAGFSQGQHLVVVTDAERRRQIAAACREPEHVARGLPPWVSVAPVHLVPCVRLADYRRRYAAPDKRRSGGGGPESWAVPFWWVDAGAAMMLALLAAVDEGLGAGVLDIADRAAVRSILALPDDVEPVALVTVGHPLPAPRTTSQRRGRRPPEEVVHRERW